MIRGQGVGGSRSRFSRVAAGKGWHIVASIVMATKSTKGLGTVWAYNLSVQLSAMRSQSKLWRHQRRRRRCSSWLIGLMERAYDSYDWCSQFSIPFRFPQACFKITLRNNCHFACFSPPASLFSLCVWSFGLFDFGSRLLQMHISLLVNDWDVVFEMVRKIASSIHYILRIEEIYQIYILGKDVCIYKSCSRL